MSDEKIESLTKEEILDKINNKNVSQIFLKEKDFKAIVFSKIFLDISLTKKIRKRRFSLRGSKLKGFFYPYTVNSVLLKICFHRACWEKSNTTDTEK